MRAARKTKRRDVARSRRNVAARQPRRANRAAMRNQTHDKEVYGAHLMLCKRYACAAMSPRRCEMFTEKKKRQNYASSAAKER